MTVIDASAAIELILRTELGESVELRALDPHERLYAPLPTCDNRAHLLKQLER